jgi:glycosyltransferase involved in cell wall biosynthesis
MKITMVATPYPWRPIGALRVVYEYANNFTGRGHDVTIVHGICRDHGSPLRHPKGIERRLRSTAYAWRDRLMKPSIRWHDLDRRVHLSYVGEPFADTIPDGDAVIAGVWGTVGYVREYPKEKGEKFHLIQHYAVTFGNTKEDVHDAWRAPVHNILIAKWLYALAQEMGCTDNRYIPNGMDTKKYRLIRPLNDRPLRVVMLYHPFDWKGSADGIRAIEIARQKYPQLQVVFFSAQARPANLPPWAEFHRDPPQEYLVEKIYNGSRIFLCPSWSEGFPLPPAEAMACGCALVTTDNGGTMDYAEHEKTALVSPPRNPEALATNLLRILDDDGLRLRIAQAGMERIGQFTWEKSTTDFENAIRESLQQRQA